jgi:IstB-like ATP binding protein
MFKRKTSLLSYALLMATVADQGRATGLLPFGCANPGKYNNLPLHCIQNIRPNDGYYYTDWAAARQSESGRILRNPKLLFGFVKRGIAGGHIGGDFLAHQRNILLVDGTGTGKSHLSIAIARACIRGGARGRLFNAADLVNKFEAQGRSGRQGRPGYGSTWSAACMNRRRGS